MNNKIKISNIAPQEIQINTGGGISGITNVYVNGVDVTLGTKAYVIVPTKLSELTNDEGFITSETDPTVPSYVKAISLSDINSWNSKQDALVSGTNIKTINNNNILGSGNIEIGTEYEAGVGINITGNTINNTIRSYNDLEDLPTIPTRISQLVNDKGFVSYNTHDLTNYLETSQLKKILPRVSETGTDLTLNDTIEFKMDFDILPSEIQQIRTTGKNLLQNNGTTTTLNGLTFTKNEDGTIKVNGTATAQTIYNINESVVLNGTYIITGCPTNGADATYFLQIYGTGAVNEYGNGATTSNINAVVRIVIRNGVTLNNLVFKPMIRLSSVSDSSYEPYTGGKPSPSIAYPQEIYATRGNNQINICGKNMFDKDSANVYNGYFTPSSPTITSNVNHRIVYIPIQPNTTYTIQKSNAGGDNTRFAIGTTANIPTTGVAVSQVTLNNTATSLTITTNASAKYLVVWCYFTSNTAITFDNLLATIQIEEGSTATTFEPYQGNSFPFNLNFPYGEDVYFKYTRTGQGITYYDRIFKNTPNDPDYTSDLPLDYIYLRKQHVFRVLSTSDDWTYERLDNYSIFRLENGTEHCAISVPFSNYFSSPNIINIGGDLEIYIPDSDGITNLEEFKTFLDDNDVYIMYPTGYPEYISLDTDVLGYSYYNLQTYNTAYDGVTHISQVNDELPFEITASTFKKID